MSFPSFWCIIPVTDIFFENEDNKMCTLTHTQYKTSSIRPSLTFSSRQLPIELILVLRTAYTLPLDSIHQVDNGSDPTDWILGRPVDDFYFSAAKRKKIMDTRSRKCAKQTSVYCIQSRDIAVSQFQERENGQIPS